MELGYNLENLGALFKEYLLAGNKNKDTVKNYLSDFRHFAGWLIFKFKVQSSKFKVEEVPSNILSFITSELINEYKSYLIENNLPYKTINRRLSTVRKFCSFCISQGWLKENPGKQIQNAGVKLPTGGQNQILTQYEQDLLKQNFDQSTINSFLDDVREFLQV
jgi:site-specific recombinase XerD